MSYIFGEGTPYDYGDMQRRRIAQQLPQKKRDGFNEGLNAVLAALEGGGEADKPKSAANPYAAPEGGSAPLSAALGADMGWKSATPATVPSGDMAGTIRSGLVSRGLPEHVADAFIVNFQDESGLNPGINEIAPIVPGSRGGFGLYQLTGPRRRDYEAFAAQRGVDPADVDAQLDWLMHELQGPEARAAQAILSSPDTASAAVAIVDRFLRPAEEHRARRVARYRGIG